MATDTALLQAQIDELRGQIATLFELVQNLPGSSHERDHSADVDKLMERVAVVEKAAQERDTRLKSDILAGVSRDIQGLMKKWTDAVTEVTGKQLGLTSGTLRKEFTEALNSTLAETSLSSKRVEAAAAENVHGSADLLRQVAAHFAQGE